MKKKNNELVQWLKVAGLFFIKSFSNYVWIKIVFLGIVILEDFITQKRINFDSYHSICLGLGIYMAMNTTYIVNNQKFRLWSKTFGYLKVWPENKEEKDDEFIP